MKFKKFNTEILNCQLTSFLQVCWMKISYITKIFNRVIAMAIYLTLMCHHNYFRQIKITNLNKSYNIHLNNAFSTKLQNFFFTDYQTILKKNNNIDSTCRGLHVFRKMIEFIQYQYLNI